MDKFPKTIIKNIPKSDDYDNRISIFMKIDEQQLKELRQKITIAIESADRHPIFVNVEAYAIRSVLEVMKELYKYGWEKTFIIYNLRTGSIGYPEWLYISK